MCLFYCDINCVKMNKYVLIDCLNLFWFIEYDLDFDDWVLLGIGVYCFLLIIIVGIKLCRKL